MLIPFPGVCKVTQYANHATWMPSSGKYVTPSTRLRCVAASAAPLLLRANKASVFPGFQLNSDPHDSRTWEYNSAAFVSAGSLLCRPMGRERVDVIHERNWQDLQSLRLAARSPKRPFLWVPLNIVDEAHAPQPPCHASLCAS